jgi:hypothetical protein
MNEISMEDLDKVSTVMTPQPGCQCMWWRLRSPKWYSTSHRGGNHQVVMNGAITGRNHANFASLGATRKGL